MKILKNYMIGYSKNFIEFFINIFSKDLKKELDDGLLLINPFNKENYNENPYEKSEVYGINNFEKKSENFFLYSRLDIGYGKKNYGILNGGSGPHVDNPQRLISILIFFRGFSSIQGGEHRIYEKKDNKLVVFESFEPKKNRLIASVQKNNSFHGVNPIKDISGQRNACYLAISCTKKIWKNCEQNSFNKKYNSNRYQYNSTDLFFRRFKRKIKFSLLKIA